jgi:hypothetical protein
MRLARTFAAAAVLLLALGTGDAHAKKSKGKKGKKGKDDVEIVMTDIKAFDDVFVRVAEIDGTLSKAEKDLRRGRLDLNDALGIKKKTPIADGLAELADRAEGKLQLAVDGQGIPKLEASDAIPTDVQQALDSVNSMTSNFSTSVDELMGLDKEIDKLVKKTGKMPTQLKSEFEGNLFDTLFKLPKTSKALQGNLQITAGLPDRSAGVAGEMGQTLDIVRSEFRPGDGGKAGGGKTGGGKKTKELPKKVPTKTKG